MNPLAVVGIVGADGVDTTGLDTGTENEAVAFGTPAFEQVIP